MSRLNNRATSRLYKVLQHRPKPEARSVHAAEAASLLRRQAQRPARRTGGELIDRVGLAIGRDLLLQALPELIHRVELRPLLGQPYKTYVEGSSQSECRCGRVPTALRANDGQDT